MIRFIEIGNQITLFDDKEFTWYTTISDQFIEFGGYGNYTWSTWKEFEEDFVSDLQDGNLPESWDLERFWGLYPKHRKKREGIMQRAYIENRLIQGGNWEE